MAKDCKISWHQNNSSCGGTQGKDDEDALEWFGGREECAKIVQAFKEAEFRMLDEWRSLVHTSLTLDAIFTSLAHCSG